jgi:hypothetical protein
LHRSFATTSKILSPCITKHPIDDIVDCRFRLVSELITELVDLVDEHEGRFFSSDKNGVASIESSKTMHSDDIILMTNIKKIKKNNVRK